MQSFIFLGIIDHAVIFKEKLFNSIQKNKEYVMEKIRERISIPGAPKICIIFKQPISICHLGQYC